MEVKKLTVSKADLIAMINAFRQFRDLTNMIAEAKPLTELTEKIEEKITLLMRLIFMEHLRMQEDEFKTELENLLKQNDIK